MKTLATILAGALCLPLLAQEKAAAPQTEYKTESNIPYRDAKEEALTPYQAERCVLDIYHPEGPKGFSTVVWFHGGGLSKGEKSIPKALKSSGLAVVAVNYRLIPKVKCAESIDDAAAAVAWTLKNIERYGGSPDGVFVSGHSAGGYLAAMIGLDKSQLAKYGADADKLAGLIPLSGHAITHFAIRGEKGISDKKPLIDEFAPLYHVRGDAPPILLITGDREKEMLGRYEENAYLARMLKVNGHKDVTLYELQGYGHGMVEPALPPMKAFIERVRPTPKPDPKP